METRNKNKNVWISILPAMVTIILNALFLWGKLIDFPRGTKEGGRIAAIGTCMIVFSVAAVTYLIIRLTRKN